MVSEKRLSRYTLLVVIALLMTGSAYTDAAAQVAKGNEAVSLKVALRDMLQANGAKSLKKLAVTVGKDESDALMTKRGVKLEGVVTVYQGIDENGMVMGSVVQINEEGKEGPLQVLVAFLPNGEVFDIGFTVFGEDRGKPALSWPFLKQFVGKTSETQMVLGKGVDGISGATWTSNSVASAVRKAVVLFDAFVKESA